MVNSKSVIKYVVSGFIALGLLIVAFNSFTIVNSGCTGVVTVFGAVKDTPLSEGIHFKLPFISDIIVMDNRTQKIDVQGSASSKDLQVVSSTVSVNYRLDGSSSAAIYKTVGKSYEATIIQPAVPEAVKAVTAKYTAEELLTKRQEVSEQIKDALSEKVGSYGIKLENFNVTNFDFSEEFNKAVESKQTAQQNALKAEQDLARIKIEAQQQVEQAKAEAEALKLKSQQVTPDMVKLEFIKKWDGKLPTVSGGSGTIMNIDSLINSAASTSSSGTN